MVTLNFSSARHTRPLDARSGSVNRVSRSSARKIAAGDPEHLIELHASRGDGEEVTVEAPDNALVELEYAHGGETIRFWTSAGGASEYPGVSGPADVRGTSRGAGAIVLRALKIFGVNVEREAARVSAISVMRTLERKETELFRIDHPSAENYRSVGPEDIPANHPVLLLLHGTASSTRGSFSALEDAVEGMDASAWQVLQERYGKHLYALEHRSLSESPIENALTLVKSLPENADLHLLTFSRGGLIGELLARAGRVDANGASVAPFDDDDLRFFREAKIGLSDETSQEDVEELRRRREEEAAQLAELSKLIREKKIKVSRFARVSCPAIGTTLASGRLDLYLSIALNVIGKIPVLHHSDVFEITAGLLQAIVETRTDPRLVPGLEAMMSGSPLIAMLNNPDVRLDGDLTAIIGDVEPEGFFRALAIWAADGFYGGDHDFIVDTGSMLGGAPRANGVRYLFDKGPDVNHFSYFANAKTLKKTLAALAGETDGFEVYDAGGPPIPRGARVAPAIHGPNEAPTLFVLPGIMGTAMVAEDDAGEERTLWVNYLRIAFGAVGEIADLTGPVKSGEPLDSHYRDLIAHMSRSHHVIRFGFDWRCRLVDEADRLAEAVEDALTKAPDQPVRFLAHSMGGLLVRVMMARHRAVWNRVAEHPDARFVMLGTPNGGSHAIIERLVGLGSLVRQLHVLDVTHSKRELLELLRGIPGVLDLLPHDANGVWFAHAKWAKLHAAYDKDWDIPDPADLETARAVRGLLSDPASRDDERTFYVAGLADETPIDVEPDPSRWWGPKIRVVGTDEGDGLVPWSSGVIDESRTWYANSQHADLSRDAANFEGYEQLLQEGATNRFASTRPRGARGAQGRERRFEIEPGRGSGGFGAHMLQQMPMGGAPAPSLKVGEAAVAHVGVEHANLSFSDRIIAVGHYDGEPLVGAERFIDERLNGKLKERRRLGLYPGPLGTSEVVVAEGGSGGHFPGTVIVGLGHLGKLSVGSLSKTLTRAFLDYALWRRERADISKRSEPLATLLIGHSESRLTLKEAIEAMLDALVRANRTLAPTDRIADLRIVELYDTVAHMAAKTLQELSESEVYRRDLKINPLLKTGEGGRRSTTYAEERGYYNRISITENEEDDNELLFTFFGDSAAARSRSKALNKEAIDAVLKDLTQGVTSRREDSRFLLDLMLPHEMRRMSLDQRNLHLILDEGAAAYPWELIDDAKNLNEPPLPVRCEITRQLTQRSDLVLSLDADLKGALIVGDPKSHLVALPGARKEAEAVAKEVRNGLGWRDAPMIQPEGIAVIRSLLRGDHKIVHIAGHGEYLKRSDKSEGDTSCEKMKKSARTGLVLGRELRLDSRIVDCMPCAPELVFLNCCHLGGIARPDLEEALRLDRHRLAANLAVAFMRKGSRAVVAAGWEVEDHAAEAFATAFYRALCSEGRTFGEAVKEGRSAAFQLDKHVNTWGAYQCYGDPDYRLVAAGPTTRRSRTNKPFVALSEAIRRIENIREGIAAEGRRNLDELRRRLDRVIARIAESEKKHGAANWMSDPELNIALAQTRADLGDFAEAISCYDKAIRATGEGAGIFAIEQRANLRARLAASQFLKTPAADRDGRREEMRAHVDQSIQELEGLIDVAGPTVERLWLLASAHRRKSLLETEAAKFRKALKDTAMEYRRAYEVSLTAANPKGWNRATALNALLAAFVLKKWSSHEPYQNKARSELKALAEEIEASLPGTDEIENQPNDAPEGFWKYGVIGDVALLRALTNNDLPMKRMVVFNAYRDAWTHGGSFRNMSSVLEGLQYYIEMIGRLQPQQDKGKRYDPAEDLKALNGLLTQLRDLVT